MAGTRIEQLIEDIYTFIEGCKMQPLSQTKVIVPKDELYDLLDELRLRTPDEIKRYQKIIANRDGIIAQAEQRAAQIQEEAKAQAIQMINENEIMQQAYFKANEMVQNATAEAASMRKSAEQDAEQIRTGALAYTNDILTEVESILSKSYKESQENSERLVGSLKINLDIIRENQAELIQQLDPIQKKSSNKNDVENSEIDEDDYNFPDGIFLKDI